MTKQTDREMHDRTFLKDSWNVTPLLVLRFPSALSSERLSARFNGGDKYVKRNHNCLSEFAKLYNSCIWLIDFALVQTKSTESCSLASLCFTNPYHQIRPLRRWKQRNCLGFIIELSNLEKNIIFTVFYQSGWFSNKRHSER